MIVVWECQWKKVNGQKVPCGFKLRRVLWQGTWHYSYPSKKPKGASWVHWMPNEVSSHASTLMIEAYLYLHPEQKA